MWLILSPYQKGLVAPGDKRVWQRLSRWLELQPSETSQALYAGISHTGKKNGSFRMFRDCDLFVA